MFNRFFLLVCFLFILLSECFGIRIKRGLDHLESNDKTKTSSTSEVLKHEEIKRASNNLDDMNCSAKGDNKRLFDSSLIESLSHEHGEKGKNLEVTASDEKDKIRVEKSAPHKSVTFEDTSLKKESGKGVKEDALQDVAAKQRDDKDMEELKHLRAQAHDASAETKLDTKKLFKPDLDIFMYSKMPQLHKVSPFYDLFNTKEELTPYEHLYPFKWQRRSPIQSAFEIANMMVKVGLDELDSDDYNDQIPFFETNNKMSYRNDRNPEKYFCPLHTLQKPIEGNNAGPQVLQVCSCHLMKKAADNDHEHLTGQKEKDLTGEPTH